MGVFGNEFAATARFLHNISNLRYQKNRINGHRLMEGGQSEALGRVIEAERLVLQEGARRNFTEAAWEKARRTLAAAEKDSIRVFSEKTAPQTITFRLASGLGRWRKGAVVRLEFGTGTHAEQFHFSVLRPVPGVQYQASLHKTGGVSTAYAAPATWEGELPNEKGGAAAVGKLISNLISKPNREDVVMARKRYLGKPIKR